MLPPFLLPMISAAKKVVSVVAVTVFDSDTAVDPANASAFGSFNSNGSVNTSDGAQGTWLIRGANSDYEIFLSGTGDSPTGAALDTWLALSTTRTWTLSQTVIGEKSFSGTIQIRNAATEAVLDTGSFTLSVIVS